MAALNQLGDWCWDDPAITRKITNMASKRVLANLAPTAAEAKANIAIVPDDKTNIGVISKAIMAAFDTYADAGNAADDAKKAHTEADANALTKRETILCDMAAMSAKHGWLAKYLGDAADLAVTNWCKGKNRTPASLDQLKTELVRVMNPGCRDYVRDAFVTSREAWDAERANAEVTRAANKAAKALDKNAPQEAVNEPLAKAFAKRYHMVVGSKGMLAAHIDAASDKPKAVFSHEEAADPHMLAATRQQVIREDPKAAARTLEKLVDAMERIYSEFPADSLKTMVRFAKSLNADTLSAAKAKAQREAARSVKTSTAKPEEVNSAIDDISPV